MLARVYEKHRQVFEHAALPLYGVGPEWHGSRFIGDYEFRSSHGTDGESAGVEYGLIHGDGDPRARPEQPYLRVVTSTADVLGGSLRSQLETAAEPPPGPEEIVRIAAEAGDEGEWDELPEGSEEAVVTIPVDGERVPFEALVRGDAWVARHLFGAAPDSYVVTIQARHFDPAEVSLVRITDLAPYIRGWLGRIGLPHADG